MNKNISDNKINSELNSFNNDNHQHIRELSSMVLNDLNNMMLRLKSMDLNNLTEFYTMQFSNMYKRPSHLSDNRFIDDLIY